MIQTDFQPCAFIRLALFHQPIKLEHLYILYSGLCLWLLLNCPYSSFRLDGSPLHMSMRRGCSEILGSLVIQSDCSDPHPSKRTLHGNTSWNTFLLETFNIEYLYFHLLSSCTNMIFSFLGMSEWSLAESIRSKHPKGSRGNTERSRTASNRPKGLAWL